MVRIGIFLFFIKLVYLSFQLFFKRITNDFFYKKINKYYSNYILRKKYIQKKQNKKTYSLYKDLIRQSVFFDEDWYKRKYSVSSDPVMDYIKNSKDKNPGPYFSSSEYLALNPSAINECNNPLVHYELNKNKYDVSSYFLPMSIDSNICNSLCTKKQNVKRVCLITSNGSDLKENRFLFDLISEIHNYCDYIFLCCDSAFLDDYLGYYKYIDGYLNIKNTQSLWKSISASVDILRKNELLESAELVLLNNSFIGDIKSISAVFEKWTNHLEKNDFFNLLSEDFFKSYSFLPDCFFLFKEYVVNSKVFLDFFSESLNQNDYVNYPDSYITSFFSKKLAAHGFNCFSYISSKESGDIFSLSNGIFEKEFEILSKNYNLSLLNKSWIRSNLSLDNLKEYNCLCDYFSSISSVLSSEKVDPHSNNKTDVYPRLDIDSLKSLFKLNEQRISEKYQKTSKITVCFIVSIIQMFGGKSLVRELLNDERFNVKIYIIPDLRFDESERLKFYWQTVRELEKIYEKSILFYSNNPESFYPELYDIYSNTDLIFYQFSYDFTNLYYSIQYAIRKGVLPCYINYGFPRSKYDSFVFNELNYSLFWKVFCETQFQYDDYKLNGPNGAFNAVVSGYSKIDCLKEYIDDCDSMKKSLGYENKKIVIIAPHHSLAHGYNRTMIQSNFLEYADFFKSLPNLYPDIVFVFRPHPALFSALTRFGYWTEQKLKDYLEEMKSKENVVFSIDDDYLKWFAISDALIHDCGSFTVEYLYTEKPCCFMLKDKGEIDRLFNDFGKKCLDNYFTAESQKDILSFIDEYVIENKSTITDDEFINTLTRDFSKASFNIKNILISSFTR